MEPPQRKLPRLTAWDYRQNGYYFITVCTKNRKHLLGKFVGNGFIHSAAGTALEEQFVKLPEHYGNVYIDNYVIMPNHFHAILVIDGTLTERTSPFPTVSSVVGSIKAGVSRQIGFSVWQTSFHDHIIRNETDYQEIWFYIDQNRKKWLQDRFYCDG